MISNHIVLLVLQMKTLRFVRAILALGRQQSRVFIVHSASMNDLTFGIVRFAVVCVELEQLGLVILAVTVLVSSDTSSIVVGRRFLLVVVWVMPSRPPASRSLFIGAGSRDE